MKIHELILDGRQYSKLEKILVTDRARKLAMNQPINGYELFRDIVDDLYMPVADGWCTIEIVLNESDEKLELLRFITEQVFPDDKDFFVRQIWKEFHCDTDFDFKIDLKF